MIWWETVPNPMCESQRYAAAREQAVGIEVEVLLRVGSDATRRRHQERHVGEERERDQLEPVVLLTALRGLPDGRRRGSVRQLHG